MKCLFKNRKLCLIVYGQTFTDKNPRVGPKLWLTESKERLKRKFKKIGMAVLVVITICEYKLSVGSLSIREVYLQRNLLKAMV